MEIRSTTDAPPDTGADTIVVGVFEDERIAHDTEDGALGALVESGEAKARFRHLAHTHAAGRRWILVGLGRARRLDPERARDRRGGGARPRPRARRAVAVLGAAAQRLRPPRRRARGGHAAGGATPTRRGRREGPTRRRPDALVVSAHHDVARGGGRRRAPAPRPPTRARDLGNAPRQRDVARARSPRGRASSPTGVDGRGDGAGGDRGGRAWARSPPSPGARTPSRGSSRSRYEPADVAGPPLGLVGKAVTFDTGGYSIKAAARMHEMKFDMCGGAAVLEATARGRRGSACPRGSSPWSARRRT